MTLIGHSAKFVRGRLSLAFQPQPTVDCGVGGHPRFLSCRPFQSLAICKGHAKPLINDLSEQDFSSTANNNTENRESVRVLHLKPPQCNEGQNKTSLTKAKKNSVHCCLFFALDQIPEYSTALSIQGIALKF